MRNSQKGFAVPLLIAIIAVLVIGGGAYIYENQRTETPTSSNVQNQQLNQISQTSEQNAVVTPVTQSNQQISMANWKTYVNSEAGYTISYPPTYHQAYGNDLFNFDENKYENGNSAGVKIQIQKTSGSINASKADVTTVKYTEKVTNGPGGTFDTYSVTGLNGTKYFTILVWGLENDSQIVSKILSTFHFSPVTSQNTNNIKPSITVTGIPIIGNNVYPGSRVPFLNFTIKATGKDVTIDSFIIQKKGTLRTNVLTKIVLINNNGVELAQGTPFNQYDSSNIIKPITIKAGETKTFWLHTWIASDLSIADKNQYATLAISAINPSDWQNTSVLGNWAVTSNNMVVNLLEYTTPTPVLNNIYPSSGSIGTEFTLSGQNLNGFGGTTDLTLVSQSGQKGVIGVNSHSSQGTTLKFVLPSSMCTVSLGESGKPCPSYFVVTPGSYQIFAQPWSKQSNVLNLTITPQNAQLITVSSPVTGSVLRVGQPYQITWSGHFERGDEVFSINSFPTNSDTFGTIATVPIAQASCTGSGMGHWSDPSTCYYTWTPTYPTPNLKIQVFNNVDGNQFGYSGVFSISQ